MWPMLLDYTKDECKRILRRLELEAYASIISVFRAQGDLSKEKKKLLQELQQTLSISTERHRAEVRRAVNDEKLTTIADNISGSMNTSEWMVEGRRLVPLMPRLVPQTAFTATANQAASAMMEKNASLPPPSQTWSKDGPTAAIPKAPRSSSPASNVVVLPSGTSNQIKGMLNQEEDEDLTLLAKRSAQRSLSTDSQNAASVSTQTPRITYTTASNTLPGSSPVKITISKSPQGRPINVQSSSQPPKVILVTSASSASGTTVTMQQRSMSVPVVKSQNTSLSTYPTGMPARSSVLVPTPGPSGMGHVVSVGGQSTMTTSSTVTTTTTAGNLVSSTVLTPVVSSSSAVFSPSVQIGSGKVRPRIVPRQRYPTMIAQQKPGVVLPMGPQLVSPAQSMAMSSSTPSSYQVAPPQQATQASAGIQVTPSPNPAAGIQVKTLNKPTIQIKQEGGMKIITQGGTSKILPKPSQIGASTGGAPVVMVNTASGQTSTVTSTVLPRSISTYTAHSGGKVLNITTPGGRVIATTTKATNVVTVNPKTLHLTAVKSGTGSTTVSKPNVIVVQKTQHPRFQGPVGQGPSTIRTLTSGLPGAIDKELMGMVHKDAQGRHILTANTSQTGLSAGVARNVGERRVIITTTGGSGEVKQPVSIIHRGRADSEGKSSLLAELIQAAGIMPPDGSGEAGAQTSDPFEFDSQEAPHPNPVSTATVPKPAPGLPISIPSSMSQSATFRQGPQPRLLRPQLPPRPNKPQPHSFLPETIEHEPDPGPPSYTVHLPERRPSPENEPGDKVITLEQAMSMFHKECVDLTEIDMDNPPASAPPPPQPPPANQPQPQSATPAGSILPTILTTTALNTPPSNPQTQPKVSILTALPKHPRPTSRPEIAEVVKPKEISIAPEEGLKEGQLDTQTGLFFQVGSSGMLNKSGTSITISQKQQIFPQVSVSATTSVVPPVSLSTTVHIAPPVSTQLSRHPPAIDLLSSSLVEADIDLDPYSEDNSDSGLSANEGPGQLSSSGASQIMGEHSVSSRPGMAEVLREETAKDGTRILTVSNPASSQQEPAPTSIPSTLSSSSSSTSSPFALALSSIPSSSSSHLVSLPSQLTRPVSHSSPMPTPPPSTTPPALVLPTQETVKPVVKPPVAVSNLPTLNRPSSQPSVMPIAVSVEPSPSVITFKLDDLTSQQVSLEEQPLQVPEGPVTIRLADTEDNLESGLDVALPPPPHNDLNSSVASSFSASGDSQSSDSSLPAPDSLVRSSKRKRKHPSGMDESTQAAPGSWIRTAYNLLMKVSKFKGSPRDRHEIPAAEWFTFPVDSQDAPDYYTVVQNPMDFSTMRKKLETSQYKEFEDFQADMELIRTNCYLYNSEGTKVRRDCDEVMAFYRSELAKLQEKQANKSFLPSTGNSPPKRSKPDEKLFPQKP